MTENGKRGAFYTKTFTCPVDGRAFPVQRMYPTARRDRERLDEFFDVPWYKPDSDGEFTNYLLLEPRVCPLCGFASIDESFFGSDLHYVEKRALSPGETERLRDQTPRRTPLLSTAREMASPRRGPEDAVLAYRLCILTSTALLQAEPRRNGHETARLGNYALRLSRITHETGDIKQREGWRGVAREYFKKAYEADIRGTLRHRSMYQLGALSIYFEDDTTAARIFEQMRNNPGGRDQIRYQARLKAIWDNRDMHRQPETGSQ